VLSNRLGAWVSTTTVIYGFNFQTRSARNREWTEAQKHIMRDRSAEGAENASMTQWTAWILLLVSIAAAPVIFFTVRETSKQLRSISADLA
jgi:hypothetical protein